MRDQRTNLSLRMRHPTRDLSVICGALGFRPTIIWKVGGERRTPKGTKIGGIRTHSYCSVNFGATTRKSLVKRIEAALVRLRPHRPALKRFSSTGGTTSFFIGWFLDADTGEVLPPQMLQELGDLRISLELCVYMPDKMRMPRVKRS
jgi:hypothetical protein